MTQKKWILATRNRGKADEFEILLSEYSVEIITLDDINFAGMIAETGSTFAENSLLKARAVQPFSELPVLADDSGLEVECLGWAPGIYSARFAGEGASDEKNWQELLDRMKGRQNRAARFVCCLTLIDNQGRVHSTLGECLGSIAPDSAGSQGFGYDSVFIPEGYNHTLGELGYEVKEKISHRTQAMLKLAENVF